MKRLAAALAFVALLTPGALGQERLTRQEALEALSHGDVKARRLGAAWLGETGRMVDASILVRALRDPDAVVRTLAESALWQIWSRSGDPEVDNLFRGGLEQMNRRDTESAIETFSEVIRKKPDFAEGWNKRATLYYLIGEYEKSLADCEEVIRRNPDHFGALSGFGLNYLKLGKPQHALDYFERALQVNPNMKQIEVTIEELKRLLIERKRRTI